MNIAQLIAVAAKEALAERPGLIGVSFSPLSISAQELEKVPAEIHKLLGKKIYVAASAPSAKPREAERVLIASDERAAEKATAWRNVVRPAEGEHLVYVSVEEHAKATGLRDCLVAIPESSLVTTLLEWMDSGESGLPKGLGQSLREARLHETRPLSVLTSFAVAARKDAAKTKAWGGVAQSLPTLGLLRDSGLSADSAALRLSANEKLVRAALSGDARRAAARGPTAELEERVRVALRDQPASVRPGVLASMDMKEVQTPRLRPAAKTRASSLPPPKPSKPPLSKKDKVGAKGTSAREPTSRADPGPQKAGPGSKKVEPVQETLQLGGERPERDRAARHRLHAASLPDGLAGALASLHAGEGSAVRVSLSKAARAALSTSIRPDQIQVGGVPALEQACKEALSRWAAARREVLALIESHSRTADVAALLVGGFSRLAKLEDVEAALQRLLEAAVALYDDATAAGRAASLEAARLDTVELYSGEQLALRLLGPLHALALGQALARSDVAQAAESLSSAARRLVRHVLESPPGAPQRSAGESADELILGRPERGLIVYERAPDAVVGEPVATLAQALVRRYVELSPHALLGLKVALLDGDEAAFVRGLERALASLPELQRIELMSRRPPKLDQDPARDDLVASGRLVIEGLPLKEQGLVDAAPHIVVRFLSGEALPRDKEAAPPAAARPASGASASTFERHEHALRVSTPVTDPGSRAFERLYAALRGRSPVGAFVSEHAAVALRSVAPPHPITPVTWHALVAPSLGRRPPLGYSLVVHDQVESAQCAILAQELRPVTRGLQQGLKRLGVQEARPSVLKSLATTLAMSTSSPLSSLWRRSELQLLAGLLALELTRQSEAKRLVVPVSIDALEHLLDRPAADYGQEVLVLALGVDRGELVPSIGLATADLEADVEVVGTGLGGKLGELTEALGAVWRLAAKGVGPDGLAAQELLNWIIWPALTSEGGGPAGIEDALRARRLQTQAPEILLLGPPPLVGALPKSKKSRVTLRSLDPAQLNTLLLR